STAASKTPPTAPLKDSSSTRRAVLAASATIRCSISLNSKAPWPKSISRQSSRSVTAAAPSRHCSRNSTFDQQTPAASTPYRPAAFHLPNTTPSVRLTILICITNNALVTAINTPSLILKPSPLRILDPKHLGATCQWQLPKILPRLRFTQACSRFAPVREQALSGANCIRSSASSQSAHSSSNTSCPTSKR